MQEIEQTKSEDGAGAMPGCWKPAYTKELGTTIAGSLSIAVGTEAVDDLNYVHTRGVEECEVCRLRGKGTLIANGVAELIGGTEVKERRLGEKIAVPFLRVCGSEY